MAPSASKSAQTKANTSQMQSKTPATSQNQSRNVQSQAQAPVAQAPTGRSPGLMTQILANAASTAGGVVAAHAIMGALGMKGSPVNDQGQMTPQAQQAMEQAAQGPCSVQFEAFTKCAENAADVGSCQWAVDMFKDCQKMNGAQTAPAPQFESSSSLPSYSSSSTQKNTSDYSQEKSW